MSLQMNDHELAYEERTTRAVILPTRHTRLRLEIPAGPPWTGRSHDKPHESVAVAIEVSTNGGAFSEVSRTGFYDEPGVHELDMPRAPAEEDDGPFIMSGKRRTTFRLRLLHRGRAEPRVRLSVLGL